MRYLPTYVLGFSLLLSACGGPQELSNLDQTDKDSSGGACALGAGGADSDRDGLSDACEVKLGTPSNNSDCDGDGISDSMDDPKDCQPNNPDKTCDAACQENRNRLLSQISDSMLLGGSSIGGRAYPGVTTVIRKNFIAFANANGNFYPAKNGLDGITSGLKDVGVPVHRLPENLCKAKGANFYLYTFGDVSSAQLDANGNVTSRITKKTDINFEVCGKMSGYNPETGLTGNIEVFYYGTTFGAIPKTALVSESGQSTSSFTLSLSSPVTSSSTCNGVSASGTLYDRMSMVLETDIHGVFDKLITSDGKEITSLGGNYVVDRLYDQWKRPRLNFSCDRITPEGLYGAAGFWAKG